MKNKPGLMPNMGKNMPGQKNNFLKGKNFFIPKELEENVLIIVKRNNPEFFKNLEELKKSNKKKYDLTITSTAKLLHSGRLASAKSLEKDLVRGAYIDYQTRELSLVYENADENQKGKIKEELKSKLNELFDIRTKMQESRVNDMEKDLMNIKNSLIKRKENKDKIIEQRLLNLTRNNYMNW